MRGGSKREQFCRDVRCFHFFKQNRFPGLIFHGSLSSFFSGRDGIRGQKHVCSKPEGHFRICFLFSTWPHPGLVSVMCLVTWPPTLKGHPRSWPLRPWTALFLVERWRKRWQRWRFQDRAGGWKRNRINYLELILILIGPTHSGCHTLEIWSFLVFPCGLRPLDGAFSPPISHL